MELENALKKRSSLKGRLTVFKNFATKIESDIQVRKVVERKDVLSLQSRLEKIELLSKDFGEVQDFIEIQHANFDEQLQERTLFEDTYEDAVALARSVLESFEENVDGNSVSASINAQQVSEMNISSTNNSGNAVEQHHVRLPQIQLPTFDSSYESWLSFRDTFLSLIHNNRTIDPVAKYYYLKSSVKGTAAQVINSLELTASNYEIAWELLCSRFNNERLLISNHVKALFSLPALTTESAEGLRNLLDCISKNLSALKALDEPVDKWDTLLIHIACEKLDKMTARRWGESSEASGRPTLDDFKTFLLDRADVLQTLHSSKEPYKQSEQPYRSKPNKTTFSKTFVATGSSCPKCKGDHTLSRCAEFLKLSTNARVEMVKKLKFCLNCMNSANHFSKDCHGGSCRKCNGRHHTLLHFDRDSNRHAQEGGSAGVQSETSPTGNNTTAVTSVSMSSQVSNGNCGEVVLATALVQIVRNGVSYPCRALLDSGSQHCFITESLCDKLGIEKTKFDISVVGINQVESTLKHRCRLKIQSCYNAYETTISCLILPKLCDNLPSNSLCVSDLQIPKHLNLADPEFHKVRQVDMLLGANVFWQLLCVGQINLKHSSLILQKTRLGWIVSGPLNGCPVNGKTLCHFASTTDINEQLSKFWEVEEGLGSTGQLWSEDDKRCEQIFKETTYRDCDGRFVVNIPFKDSLSKLGDSRESALKRFYALENRLQKNPDLKLKYSQFMNEYESLGHMSRIEETSGNLVPYYFQHHGVNNSKSTTTSYRVVFNGSAPSDSGYSLNDLQFVGPTIQVELLSLLLKLRWYNVVISADITKMYRQILVNPEQRCLQRIFWRSDVKETVQIYELNTVTYGTTSAPFLAIRCLKQLAAEHSTSHPNAARVIDSDFYVDDLLTGGASVEEVLKVCKEVISILSSAHFELRKWNSNSQELLNNLQNTNNSANQFHFCDKENKHILGLLWDSNDDTLTYHVKEPMRSTRVNKRIILSDIAQIFDPLGLLSPCVIIAKIILQDLWKLKVSWDEALPVSIHTQWQEFRSQLVLLNSVEIQRKVICANPVAVELHGFSDSSQNAYGGCVYIRSVDTEGYIHVALLCSKARVAPVKQLSIPRLELCGALVLSQLVNKVTSTFKQQLDDIFLWSDSMVVLGWLQSDPSQLQTFVGNRVAQIQQLTDISCWGHVRTQDNPSDLLSRGVRPRDLANLQMWWEGPPWLSKPSDLWPVRGKKYEGELPEQKKQGVTSFRVASLEKWEVINKYSSFSKLVRVIAYCHRFAHNCRQPRARYVAPLSVDELHFSAEAIIKISQRECFSNDLDLLKQGRLISSKSRLVGLGPFIDNKGILRVGGRIQRSQFEYNKKHPIILSASHRLTYLLFVQEHIRLMHAGPQLLLSSVRDEYWPLQGRNLARKIVRECVVCFRANPKGIQLHMGMLPGPRVQPLPPFSTVGTDYAGPFYIKEKGRHNKPKKCYICLYVCFSTKAIHLDVVSDLSTEAFIACFRRFVSRRGKPEHIYSDNGKNFVGANAVLKELCQFVSNNQDSLAIKASELGVTWHFIPSYSPHFGGLWEAGVKSSKYHLKRILSNAMLSYEEFYTVLTQIEAILNSRPLVPLSPDPGECEALSPSHFLIGKRLTSLPDPSLLDIKESRLSKYQRLQQLQQHFWKRWSKEYVSELQQCVKWKTSCTTDSLEVGTLVVIKDDHAPPLQWKLGRIIAVYPGGDDIARVADIKTATGVIKRSWSKICPLPSDKQ